MTAFYEFTITNHTGLHMDLSHNMLLKNKTIDSPSPFNRKLQSKFHTSVRFYKGYSENKITKQDNETKVQTLLEIEQQ